MPLFDCTVSSINPAIETERRPGPRGRLYAGKQHLLDDRPSPFALLLDQCSVTFHLRGIRRDLASQVEGRGANHGERRPQFMRTPRQNPFRLRPAAARRENWRQTRHPSPGATADGGERVPDCDGALVTTRFKGAVAQPQGQLPSSPIGIIRLTFKLTAELTTRTTAVQQHGDGLRVSCGLRIWVAPVDKVGQIRAVRYFYSILRAEVFPKMRGQ